MADQTKSHESLKTMTPKNGKKATISYRCTTKIDLNKMARTNHNFYKNFETNPDIREK